MCLGIPGQITEVGRDGNAPMARADFAGQIRSVCLAYLPDLKVGDYIIAHLGYAVTLIDADDGATTLAVLREYGVLDPVQP
jgi:hydrogenase expression/formation protein HypC